MPLSTSGRRNGRASKRLLPAPIAATVSQWLQPSSVALLGTVLLMMTVAACALASPTPTVTHSGGPTQTATAEPVRPTPTPLPEPEVLVEPTAQPAASVTATDTDQPPSPLPTPSPTPHLLAPFTLDALRARPEIGGSITTRALLEENEAYVRSYIDYPSDGLTITGMMHTPRGEGPFPVLVLLHGYWNRDSYLAGTDTWQAADYFARQGYLVLSPDLRSWGESDSGLSLFHMGLVSDVVNLISSLPSLPAADPSRIGLWGHSMGGGIATKVLAVDDRVGAAVLYAPNSADDADLIDRWGPGCMPGQMVNADSGCNPAEVILPDTPTVLIEAYLAAAADPTFLQQVAPIHQLEWVNAPLQIHSGTADGQGLAETPPDWSARLAEALNEAGKDAAFYTYPDQGHFFTGSSWMQMLERAVALFDQELAGNAAP